MGYFIGLPSEIDAVKAVADRFAEEEDYDRDELETVSTEHLETDITVYAERDDVEVLDQGTEDGEEYFVVQPRSGEARSMLEPANTETQLEGGDNTMTDDYEFELDQTEARHAGSLEHYENEDEYGELESDEVEALGLAVYLEDAVSDESDLVDEQEMVDYIMENDVDGEAFVDFKRGLASDYDEFADTMDEFIGHRTELIEELGATGTLYQALQEETAAERDNAEEAMSSVAAAASDATTSSEWLDNVADLDGAVQRERDSAQRKEDLQDSLEDIRNDLGLDEDDE